MYLDFTKPNRRNRLRSICFWGGSAFGRIDRGEVDVGLLRRLFGVLLLYMAIKEVLD